MLQIYSSQTVWYWHENRHGLMGSSETPEINPHIYAYLIYDKGGRNIHWEKESLQ